MRHPRLPCGDARIARQRGGHAARGVLAEHQVGRVGLGEGLFVLALDRGLHRRAQRGFHRIDQRVQRQFVECGLEFDPHLGAAALRVRGRGQAAPGGQPIAHHVVGQRAQAGEILGETGRIDLPRQGGGGRAGARIFDGEAHRQLQVPVAQFGLDLDRVALPARVVGAQRLAQQQVFVAQAQARARRQPLLRSDAGLQQAPQRRRAQRLVGQRLLQLQVQARHVDAACVGIAQVDGDVDAGRHVQVGPALARKPDRHRHPVHAHPVQRPRKRDRVRGDIGQWSWAWAVVHRGIVPGGA